MAKYLIDENLPATLQAWNNELFVHVFNLPSIFLDTDIWEYALTNDLIIVTKDSDFYFRYLSSKKSPKVI